MSGEEPREAVFHITHWKAGSQWVRAVLTALAGDRIVPVAPDMSHVLRQPIRPGGVYTPVYLDRSAFECSVEAPHRRFVVIRDLRDTLVSWYFSLRYSHGLNGPVQDSRQRLAEMDMAAGLEHLIEERFDIIAWIQSSWMGGDDPVVRYEDLLSDELVQFRRICDHCGIAAGDAALRDAVAANSFERKSGRRRGQEHPAEYFRKGVAGDWRSHFDPRTTESFKRRFGWALVQTGYEKDENW